MCLDSWFVSGSPALDLRRVSFPAFLWIVLQFSALMWTHKITGRVHSQMRVSARRKLRHMHCDKHCMHCDIHCNAYLSHRPCSYAERSCLRFFNATDLASFWGEPLLTTVCPNARFSLVHGPQKDTPLRALSSHPGMNP